MFRRQILTGILSIFLFASLFGQQYTFSGYIEDQATGEKLIAATVYDRASEKGTSTNEYGFFSLTIPSGEVQLLISYVGYRTHTDSFNLAADLSMNISLVPMLELEEVVVSTNRPRDIVEDVQMSALHIPIKEI